MRILVAVWLMVLASSMAFPQAVPPPPKGVPPAQTDPPTFSFGDGTMKASRLSPYDNAFLSTITGKDDRKKIELGIWTDQLRVREVDGRKIFVRSQGLVYPDGKSMWSVNRFDRETLAPISSESHAHDGSSEKRTYHGTHVEVRTIGPEPGAKEEVREVELSKPSYEFFNCCMASIFSATLPLRPGYKAIAPNGVVTKGDDPTVVYRVVGREKVMAGDLGRVDANVVEFVNGGCCYIRFWIIDKPPYMVRMTLTPGPPGHSYYQSFDMITHDRKK